MLQKLKSVVLASLAATCITSAAQAVTLATAAGPLATDTSQTVLFTSSGGSANVSFDLLGYLSLDGDNYYTDVFSLVLNGTKILSGTYNLGGGGGSVTTLNSAGLTLTGVDPGTGVSWAGGLINFSGSVNVLSGLNSLVFAYDSPAGSNAGFQGLGDEAWGLKNLSVTVSAVPLPQPVFLLGASLLGLVALRRKNKSVRV